MSLIIFLGLISFTNVSIPAFAQQGQGTTINWLEIRRNPMVDVMITGPCDTLTTPDGYTLTPQGQHVLECIDGGTLAVITDHTELLGLKSARLRRKWQ